MKKGSYWFSFLSEKEQKEFRENCEKQDRDINSKMDSNYRSFGDFILCSFNWDKTSEGIKYWSNISKLRVQ
jgi:hypothetical protein